MKFTQTNDALDSRCEPFNEPVRFSFERHILNFPGYISVKWDDPEEAPLDIDLQTASLLAKIYEGLKPANKAKMKALCNTRKHRFCYIVNESWKLVS